MSKKISFWAVIIIFLLGLTVYWSTSYPTITWWESSEYSAAAACLGLTAAPGSIIMTFLGWILSRFSGHPAHLFNLLAGLIASLTVVFTFLVFRKITGMITGKKENEFSLSEYVLLIMASGIVICSTTIWEYATSFTPYILTALFTMFIIMAVLRWWENAEKPDSWKELFLITLLIGLDFSVHRTNAILVPGIIVIILIRNYKVFLSYKSWLAAFAGILLGWSVQLLYIPMSLNDPLLNMGETNTLSAWWDFISLKQYGGNFLTDILNRKAPLWNYQIPYYLKGFSGNFFYSDHFSYILGFIPTLLGLGGITYLFRTNRKFALAFILFFVITIISSILYFNLPENYFRTIYRHYFPTFILFTVFIFFGIRYLILKISILKPKTRRITYLSLFVLLAGVSLTQYFTNIKIKNGSKETFAADHAGNLISSVDQNGIVFNYADNHHFPEMYLQIAEKVRPDIRHCNLSLLNLGWYRDQIKRHDPDFPYKGDGINDTIFEYQNWKETHLKIPLGEEVKKKYSSVADTFRLSLPALRENKSNLAQYLALFDIIKNNRWKRPVYFVKQYFDPVLYNWLKSYLSDEGLVYQLQPDSTQKIHVRAIEKNLEHFSFHGYNDPSITLDEVSVGVGNQYYDMFLNVAKDKAAKGDFSAASGTFRRMKKALPFDRLQPGKEVQNETQRLEKSIYSKGIN